MTSWRTRSSYVAALLGLTVYLVAVHSWGASNFIRVPLGKGASIEIPKNWTVLSGSQRVTLDALVEAKGYQVQYAKMLLPIIDYMTSSLRQE
jgi:hypothetical protein